MQFSDFLGSLNIAYYKYAFMVFFTSGHCPIRWRPAGDCLRGAPVEKGENEEKNQNFWSRMANSLAIWARVRVPWGGSLPSGKPAKSPSAAAPACAGAIHPHQPINMRSCCKICILQQDRSISCALPGFDPWPTQRMAAGERTMPLAKGIWQSPAYSAEIK